MRAKVFHLGQENSRKFPRLLMSLPIDYRVRGGQYSNFTSNLSAGGAFIRNSATVAVLSFPDGGATGFRQNGREHP